jgi:GAF domain-containing protein
MLGLVFLIGMLAALNLGQGYRQARDNRIPQLSGIFLSLIVTTVVACLGGVGLGLSVWLQGQFSSFPNLFVFLFNLICAASIIQIGYAVARYNAFVEGRTIERDLVYSLTDVVVISSIYGGIFLVLYDKGQASLLALNLIVPMAIITHSLFEGSRAALDLLFYHNVMQQLRANLRLLAREAGTNAAMPERLHAMLLVMCRNLNVEKGFIALCSGDVFVVQATKDAAPVGQVFPLKQFASFEIAEWCSSASKGLDQMGLLVPLWSGNEQIGALLLGAKLYGQVYTESELELLDALSDQVATVSHAAQQQEQNAEAINQMVTDFRIRERELQHHIQQLIAAQQQEAQLGPVTGFVRTHSGQGDRDAFASSIERCLQQLHDYSYLGDEFLSHLALVEQVLKTQRIDKGDRTPVTKLDCGRALHELLLQALSKLRPQGAEPNRYEALPRQWHPYIVLYDTYVRHELTRDVMNRLYISEATFHRIRRRAVRCQARNRMSAKSRPKMGSFGILMIILTGT